MKLFFVSAVMAVFAAAPGALASDSALSGVTIEPEPSSSSDVLQDPVSLEDAMEDFEDKPANDNMFVALENPNNPNCFGIGWNTCDRRIACEWTCNHRRREDGCCTFIRGRPTRRPTRRPNRPNRPTRRPTRRPTGSGGGDFDDGLDAGRRQAMRIWRDLGNSCSSAWGSFQDSVRRSIRTNGWNSSNNWRTRSFNEGATRGMNEVVREKEQKCFRDSADECVDLGNEAARIIAYDHCDLVGRASSQSQRWRRQCRDAAITQCQGQMFDSVRDACGSSPRTRDLTRLQNQCRNRVLILIGDRNEDVSEDYDYDSEDSEDLTIES